MRRRGVVIVFTCVCLVVLIGFVALAVDVGFLYAQKAQRQKSVDAGALAGAGVLFSEFGLDKEFAVSEAHSYTNKNEPNGLTKIEVSLGEFIDGEFFSSQNPNSVRVYVNNEENLFFARVFGIQKSSVGAVAIAKRSWISETCVTPIGLRTPGFGPVDFDVSAANPGKDGPSYPSNDKSFEIGEEVVLFAFGKGPRPPVHLALDLPQFYGVAETNKLLSGASKDCALISLGDEIPIWNNGTGDGNFGEKLLDRLQDNDPGNDTIVVPVLETLVDSHDDKGKLSGDVKVVDFAGVKLDKVIEIQVNDPKSSSKTITIKLLVGKITLVFTAGEENNGTLPGYSYSVSSLRLVK